MFNQASIRSLFFFFAALLFALNLTAQKKDSINGLQQGGNLPGTETLQPKPPVKSDTPNQVIQQSCKSCIADTSLRYGLLMTETGHCVYCAKKLDGTQWLLVFLPAILFGIFIFYMLAKLNKEKCSLSDMLGENIPVDAAVANAVPQQPPATGNKPSTSRLIAFLSGLCAITIGVCSTSYYFYLYLKTGQSPNLDNLYNILLSMGIGVIPYAFNKISSAFGR